MPPKPRFLPMPRDDKLLDARQESVEKWIAYARSDEVCEKVRNFITSLRCKNGRAKKMHHVIKGGYNLVYRLEYDDSQSVVMRVPIKDLGPFLDEKVIYEVSAMRYIAANTTIPVPRVYHHGGSTENPTGLGPFIVMEYIDHHTNMSRELLDPTKPADSRPVLDPGISQDKLESLYGEMAKILLQLYKLGPFPRIGSLVEDSQDAVGLRAKVGGRPLTVNMTDLVTDTCAPHDVLPRPTQTFNSAKEWYTALARMHMAQLVFQQGDCVEDEDDARDKYVARALFEGLAGSDRLFSVWNERALSTRRDPPDHSRWTQSPSDSESVMCRLAENDGFRLFSEDLRPANVLLEKDLKVVGVIDWEFVYSAPAEFSSDPPWWLLLCQPEDYPGGIFSWMKEYDKRLGVFLRALEKEEQKFELEQRSWAGSGSQSKRKRSRRKKAPAPGPALSHRMRLSWETGRWMVNYAARKSWIFDLIWWRFLDQAYFGVNDDQDHKARVGLLTVEQRKQMEDLVASKIPGPSLI